MHKSTVLLSLLLFGSLISNAQDKIKEVLIMHHSHLDVGFTHLQPVALELHEDYITQALNLLDRTRDYPEHSRPKWTCEVTEPVMQWLENATKEEEKKFAQYLVEGRICISALEYNTTPLASSEGLARQLYDAAYLAKRFGVTINTANLHDATGLPWPIVDLLKDAGVELLTMAINLHLSGTPKPRPAVYRWKSPGGREIFVMNGEHYTMFDQWTDNHLGNLDTIKAGIDRYIRYVTGEGYPYDFVYLTATCAPSAYDNSPPNFDLPEIIKRWNEEGRQPRLRYVTPHDILERIRKIPLESIPVVSGDWTDFWNFGCGSSATETKINLNTTSALFAADMLAAFGESGNQLRSVRKNAWDAVNYYNEHTWGAWNPLEIHHPFPTAQWYLKASPAYEGMALSKFLLTRYLQQLAGNPRAWDKQEGVLLFNPSGSPAIVYPRLPGDWFLPGKRIETWLMGGDHFERSPSSGDYYSPVELPPYSWKKLPFKDMKSVRPEVPVTTGNSFIETAFYKLSFDRTTGKVYSLFDKKRNVEVIDPASTYGFFQFVHEKPDPAINPDRTAFHVRSIENERIGLTGWKPEWKAQHTGIRIKECRVDTTAFTAALVIVAEAEGTAGLEQRITLHADSPVIDLVAEFQKTENAMPEAIYFTFPLNLDPGWRGFFDTGDIPVELDREQLSGTCRDWVTVSSFASIHHNDRGAALYCPDAPLVMFGDFNYGRNQSGIPRKKNPLLLAWATNNYWETNFRGSQPGKIKLRYAFESQGTYDPDKIMKQAQQVLNPVITHPLADCPEAGAGRLVNISEKGIKVTYIKEAEDGAGKIIRIVNLNEREAACEIELPGTSFASAWRCSTTEEKLTPLEIASSKIKVKLNPREITSIRVE